ncbi:MAG: nucleotide-binding protein [Planctomycetota bacterium]
MLVRRLLPALALVALVACDQRVPVTTPTPSRTTAAAPTASDGVQGTILETMDSGGYTYMRLKTAEGEVWAAVKQTVVKVGDSVVVTNANMMRAFQSKTLDRTFDEILFGSLGEASGEVDLGGESHGATPAAKVDLSTPVAKAEGETGRTVAEVYAQKADLKGKPVAVRGKVVKFLSGIMGKNWIHLQDGSGKAEDGTHDLTVTTSGEAAVGDLVVVRGPLGVDVDFGAGYAYSVIIQDAAVEK